MTKFITISLQFPHHEEVEAVRVRLYETDDSERFRVKRGEAWVTREGVSIAEAMDLVAQELEQLLRIRAVVEPDPEPPALHLGKMVTVLGKMSYEACEDGPGLETTLYRVASPVFQDAELGWCVFLMRPAGTTVLRKVPVGLLRDARGKALTAPAKAETVSNESMGTLPRSKTLQEVRA